MVTKLPSNLYTINNSSPPTAETLPRKCFAFGLVNGIPKLYGNPNGIIVDYTNASRGYHKEINNASDFAGTAGNYIVMIPYGTHMLDSKAIDVTKYEYIFDNIDGGTGVKEVKIEKPVAVVDKNGNVIIKSTTNDWKGYYTLTVTVGGVKFPPTSYNIIYDLGGGTNNPLNPSTYTTDDLPIILLSPSSDSLFFSHWSPSDIIPRDSTGSKIFTAIWELAWGDRSLEEPREVMRRHFAENAELQDLGEYWGWTMEVFEKILTNRFALAASYDAFQLFRDESLGLYEPPYELYDFFSDDTLRQSASEINAIPEVQWIKQQMLENTHGLHLDISNEMSAFVDMNGSTSTYTSFAVLMQFVSGIHFDYMQSDELRGLLDAIIEREDFQRWTAFLLENGFDSEQSTYGFRVEFESGAEWVINTTDFWRETQLDMGMIPVHGWSNGDDFVLSVMIKDSAGSMMPWFICSDSNLIDGVMSIERIYK